jgi:hypothetical protein
MGFFLQQQQRQWSHRLHSEADQLDLEDPSNRRLLDLTMHSKHPRNPTLNRALDVLDLLHSVLAKSISEASPAPPPSSLSPTTCLKMLLRLVPLSQLTPPRIWQEEQDSDEGAARESSRS